MSNRRKISLTSWFELRKGGRRGFKSPGTKTQPNTKQNRKAVLWASRLGYQVIRKLLMPVKKIKYYQFNYQTTVERHHSFV